MRPAPWNFNSESGSAPDRLKARSRLRSRPEPPRASRVCGPCARALAAAGRAFPAEPGGGVFVDKQKHLLFWFSFIFFILLSLP